MDKEQSRKLSLKWFKTWLFINGYVTRVSKTKGLLIVKDGQTRPIMIKDRSVNLTDAIDFIKRGSLIEKEDFQRGGFYVNTYNSEGQHFFLIWDLSKVRPSWHTRRLPQRTFGAQTDGLQIVDKTVTVLDWRLADFFIFSKTQPGFIKIEDPLTALGDIKIKLLQPDEPIEVKVTKLF